MEPCPGRLAWNSRLPSRRKRRLSHRGCTYASVLPIDQRFRRSMLQLLRLAREAMVNRGCDCVITRITLLPSCWILMDTELRLFATLRKSQPCCNHEKLPTATPAIKLFLLLLSQRGRCGAASNR